MFSTQLDHYHYKIVKSKFHQKQMFYEKSTLVILDAVFLNRLQSALCPGIFNSAN